ncbi:gluconeogenesis factor YvcK family protein [Lactovum odontotermitis]
MRKAKIVVIGGGTGISVILDSLRKEEVELTAIVTVADDGGSSGKLRSAIDVAPPGDLRNVLIAMSDMPKFYERMFQYRFSDSDGSMAGHPLGNLIIAGVSEMCGSTYNAVQMLTQFFHIEGKIYPASEKALTLHAVFQDGHEVVGESHIAAYKGLIDHVYVDETSTGKPAVASRKVVQSILDADTIVLGPGSLFTSILPNLVIPEIGKALCETKAQVIYVCNIMTQRGETEHFTDADHVHVLQQHLGTNFIDTVLVNSEPVPREYMNSNKFDEYLVQVKHDFPGLEREGVRIISNNFLKLRNGGAFHDGEAVTEEIMKINEYRNVTVEHSNS